MKNFFFKISKIIADYSFRIFVVLFAIGNLFFSIERYLAVKGVIYRFSNLINIVTLLFFLLLLCWLIKKDFFNINNETFLASFLIFAAILGSIWIIINYPELIDYDDSRNCVDNARKLYNGDWGCVGFKSYVNTYPFQLTFITYLYILLRIFGYYNFLYAARFLNLLYILIGYTYLYKITKLLFKNKTTNNIIVFLMFLSTQYIYLCFFIYGTALSHSFAIVSIYYVLKYLLNDSYLSLIPAGLTIAIASAIKSNTLIILIAEIIFLFVHFIDKKNTVNVIYVALVFILYFTGSKGIQNYYSSKTNTDYSNSLPTICWIAYGLNYDQANPGGYMSEFEMFHHDNNYYTEGTKANAKWYIDFVLSRFKDNPTIAIKYYSQKFAVSFCEPSFGVFNQQFSELPCSNFVNSVIRGNNYKILYEKWDATASIVAIGLLSYCFAKKRSKNFYELIIGVVVFGGFCFHAIWETKSLYLIQYYLFLLPLAASGLNSLISSD